jgi:hypothetical protein
MMIGVIVGCVGSNLECDAADKALPTATPNVVPETNVRRLEGRRIEAASDDRTSILLAGETGKGSLSVAVKAKELQDRLKVFRAGDIATMEVADEGTQHTLRAIAPVTRSIERSNRAWALLASALALLAFSAVLLRGDLAGLLIGKDGRYSNSKFQIAIWFGGLVVTYMSTVGLRWWFGGPSYIGGVGLPQNLLLISGISAFTYGAAKGITTAKIEKEKDRQLAAGAPPAMAELAAESAIKPPATPGQRGFVWNLVRADDGTVDVGDFQMVVVTILAVAVYLAQIFVFLGSIELLKVITIPDVDSTILATFGLGQGAYLTKKYAER